MAPLRNLILIVGLSLFLLCYAAYWAYQTQYAEPRQTLGGEIAQLSSQITAGQSNLDAMNQFCEQNYWLYHRSLPPVPNDAQSVYSFWLLELLQFTGFDAPQVVPGQYYRITPGADYRFNVQFTGTLSQLAFFLFEFYYAPFLHRIASLTLTPTEGNTEILTFTMTVNVLALDSRFNPFGSTIHLPTDWRIPRLVYVNPQAEDPAAAYNVIAERNLLQVARGGIDRADHIFLTAILGIDGQEEVWFRDRTAGSNAPPIIKMLGETIQAGSFTGKIVEIYQDAELIVLDRDGTRWLLAAGEGLNEAFALPPETFAD